MSGATVSSWEMHTERRMLRKVVLSPKGRWRPSSTSASLASALASSARSRSFSALSTCKPTACTAASCACQMHQAAGPSHLRMKSCCWVLFTGAYVQLRCYRTLAHETHAICILSISKLSLGAFLSIAR